MEDTKICSQCKNIHTIKYFGKEKRSKDGLTSACKFCLQRASSKRYFKRKKENPEKERGKARMAAALWRKRNPERHRKNCSNYQRALRLEVLRHYGGEIPKCKCCGEIIIEFLGIDHINGCGGEERKKYGSGSRFYFYLKKNNYPSGYQVLCYNCNLTKGFYGVCPHNKK